MRGFAVQARVNLETIGADGTVRPTGGVLKVFEPAAGPGVRTDTYASTGYQTNPSFDSLLAKVIGHAATDDVGDALDRTSRALRELRVEGLETNVPFLQAILAHPDVRTGLATTDFVDRNVAQLVAVATAASTTASQLGATDTTRRAGAVVDASDPLAVLSHGKSVSAPRRGSRARRRRQRRARSDPGHDRLGQRRRGRRGAVRAAAARHGSDEDGARHRVDDERRGRARSRSRSVTRCSRATLSSSSSQTAPTRAASDEAEAVDLEVIRPDLAEALERQAKTPRRGASRRGGPASRDAPTHRPRERRRPLRHGHRSWSTARS